MKILYLQYSNPGAFPAAMRAGRLWRAAGHDVRYLGVDFGAADRLAIGDDIADSCDWVRFGKLAPALFAAKAAKISLGWKADWIYIADSMAALAFAPLRPLYRGGIAYHEHDSPTRANSFRLRMQWNARNAMARRADVVVLPNADRAALLAQEAGLSSHRPPIVAWNTPCRDEIGAPRAATLQGPVRVVYAGSINAQRCPMAMIDALADVRDIDLTLIGYETVSSRGYCDRLRAHASKRGCADRLKIRAAMPYDQLVAALRDYDVTFAALPPESADVNMRHMAGASNKSFDAMGQGQALIVGPGDDWHRMFVEPGFAFACDPGDSRSIAGAFQRLAADRKGLNAMGERARMRVAGDWAYDEQFAPVLRRMTDASEAAR